ncbi:hypothetical protein [Streptomyces sp. NPDC046985]|uniref:SCO2102 family sporulation regulator n=1 Tax=Streptomyces sp. NPDC046985 TaxID=3155377 RepID=UPI00340A1863
MGWTVLYIAFGGVALWLLGEVLLQYKARLRWRLLAFGGFLCVVLGVLMPSVLVIGLGAAAFAVGQTYVTLSFRRGFASGWAVRHPGPEEAKSRRGRAGRKDRAPDPSGRDAADGALDAGDHGETAAMSALPAPDGTDSADAANGLLSGDGLPYGHEDYDHDDVFSPARPLASPNAVYEPQPLPDDTGSYGVYGDGAHRDPYAAAQTADQGYGYDYAGYGQQNYGYDATGQQHYAGYSDPYASVPSYDAAASYDPAAYGGQQGYGQQYAAPDPYAASGYGEGAWVPQQRSDEGHDGAGGHGGELPPEQPHHPYQGHGQSQHGADYDEQYRF